MVAGLRIAVRIIIISMKKINFCCGFPRSMSTVFACILNQHPEVYATATSPMVPLALELCRFFDSRGEFRAWKQEDSEKAYAGFVDGAMDGFFKNLTDKPTILDKNRDAIIYYPSIAFSLQHSKFVFVVRDLQDICNSYEKKFLAHPTMFARLPEELASDKGGRYLAYTQSPEFKSILDFVRDFDFDLNKESVMILKSEDLCSSPDAVLEQACRFLGLSEFTFDFNNIKQIYENDLAHKNFVADHQIRPKLEPLNNKKRPIWRAS